MPDTITSYNDFPDANDRDVLPHIKMPGCIDQWNRKNWIFSRISSLNVEDSSTTIGSSMLGFQAGGIQDYLHPKPEVTSSPKTTAAISKSSSMTSSQGSERWTRFLCRTAE
jgi:hypothetical protein